MKKIIIIGAIVASIVLTVTPANAAVSSWGLDRIDGTIDNSYSVPYTGNGVTAYVLDTGVATSDPGFGGRASGDIDCNGHGTHVAGIIGSSQFGVAAGVKIVSIKVADCSGVVYPQDLVAGIDKVIAMNKGPAVVNISIAVGKSATVDAAINRLYTSGILSVVAASNTNTDACKWSPSGTANAFTVAGINKNDQRTNTSAYGDCVDIFAPGGLIDSEDWKNPSGYKTMTGTSMAAPHVAGVAALYLEKNPTARPAEVAKAISDGALKGVVVDALSANNLLLNTAFLGSVSSNPVFTTKPSTGYTIPSKPTSIYATAVSGGYRLSWTAPINAITSVIIGYKVETSSNGNTWGVVLTTSTADTNAIVLVAGYYRISAIGIVGTSVPSLTLRVVK